MPLEREGRQEERRRKWMSVDVFVLNKQGLEYLCVHVLSVCMCVHVCVCVCVCVCVWRTVGAPS